MVLSNTCIQVIVVYAEKEKQFIQKVKLPANSTILDAIKASHITEMCPDINLSVQLVGVFGRRRQLSDLVAAGDQIEIYRPLKIDPKNARQLRVARSRQTNLIDGRRWQQRSKKGS